MSKKTLIFSLIFTGISLLAMIVGLSAQEDQELPEEVIINNEGYKHDRKGPVEFTHIDHADLYEVACNKCHHYYEDGKNVWQEGDYVPKCSECHYPDEDEGNAKNLRLSFHKLCKGCHEDLRKQGLSKYAPFRKCRSCHQDYDESS
jgi:predicted CXXCH cytochrome family protein